MNAFALDLLDVLARTTLLLAAAAVIVRLLLWAARSSSPTAHRAAWLLVLAQGWLFLRMPVAIPYYEARSVPDHEARSVADYRAAAAVLHEEAQSVRSAAERERLVDEQAAPGPAVAASASDGALGASHKAAGPPDVVASASDGAAPPTALAADAFMPSSVSPAPLEPTSTSLSQSPAAEAPWSWPRVLAGAWLAGIGLLMAGWLLRYVRFVRRLPPGQPADEAWVRQWEDLLAARGIRRKIPLRVTARLGPLVCRLPGGYQLLVPAGLWGSLTPAGRLSILRHELAHYRRGDGWKSLAVRLLALPHWFNPLAWWAVRKFEEAAEWACDRQAAQTGPEHAADYVRALLRLTEPARGQPAFGRAAAGRGLSVRIRRILTTRPLEDSAMKKLLVIAVALGLVAVCLIRFDLVAKDVEADDASAGMDAAADPVPAPGDGMASIVGTESDREVRGAAAETPVDRQSLRYDGKSFYQWQAELRRELKPERRAEAISALAAFAAHGYGKEAASAIVEVMRQYDARTPNTEGEKLVKEAADAAFRPIVRAGADGRVFPGIQPADSVPVLVEELKTGSRNDRLFATSALSAIGPEAKAALPVLVETIKEEKDPTFRNAAFELVATHDEEGRKTASAFRHLIREGDEGVLAHALGVLISGGVPAILRREPAPKAKDGKPRDLYEPSFGRALRSPRGIILAPKAGPVLEVLIEALEEERPPTRWQVIATLGRIGAVAKDAEVVGPLVQAFKKGDVDDRVCVAQTLGGMGPAAKDAVPVFLEAMHDKQPAVRRAAIGALAGIGPEAKEAVEPLIQSFQKGDPEDRPWIAHALGSFGPAAKEAIPILEQATLASGGVYAAVRRAAEEALGKIRPPEHPEAESYEEEAYRR